MKNNLLLKIADGLLILERGDDEILLANNVDFRPLYINKGREYIKTFLKAAGELATYKSIIKAYPQDRSLLDVLLEYRILVPRESAGQEKQLATMSSGSPPSKKRSLSLYLLLSQSCNMRCVYCLDGRQTYQTDKNLRMSKEIAFKSIDRGLDDVDERGCLEVIFFGGEPLLNWPLAKEVITYCEQRLGQKHQGKQRQYHFTSNLSFLPDDLIEWAKKYDISFLCDIDGPAAIHDRCRPFHDGGGTYESTARNIRRVSEAGLRIDLRATITALNQDNLLDIAREHKLLGGKSCAFCPVNPVDSDENILLESLLPSPEKVISGLREVYRSKLWTSAEMYPFNQYASRLRTGLVTALGCGAAYGSVPAVDAHGDVYPCIYLVGIERFHLGNIMDASYPHRDLLRRLYDELQVGHLEDCKQCCWRYLCSGSCPLGRLTISNNTKASEAVKTYCRKIRCDVTKSTMEMLLWEMAEQAVSNGKEGPVHAPSCL